MMLTTIAPALKEVFSDKKNSFLCEFTIGSALKCALVDLKQNSSLMLKIAKNGNILFNTRFIPEIGEKRPNRFV